MRWFHTVILLAVPVLAVGCVPITPITPAEAGENLVLALGFGCVLTGLSLGPKLLKVEERKMAARFLVALLLIGGGLIALGGWLAGWWGQ